MTSTNSAYFDRAYRRPVTLWGDIRIPPEIAALVRQGAPNGVLDLGCGVGRLTRYVARQGLRVTGVDFSSVAIEKARARVAADEVRPDFIVGDVTNLDALTGPFDLSFDVGCFHCLDATQQGRYGSELHRLLAPGGTHLIWALDAAPSGIPLDAAAVERAFTPRFALRDARASRRRLLRSHWYWLVRSAE
ncbi:class I SAM-dependent methyltransferase [Sorangium sp. So ce1000]|uniref:class I SAM-dependent methyltransferase n=1 Tax=Sorangium sp. So ce1000 TaxID=3133325 RepID=UPI003F5D9DE7